MQAKDVMTAKVVSVSKDTPVHEVVGLLLKYRISAVPVIDEARQVLGIVSEGDLLRSEGTSHPGARQPWWLAAVLARHGLSYDMLQSRTAGDVMTRKVYSVDEDAPLSEIAELLERCHIKRVPVLRNGKLVGIVSRANLLHGLASTIIEHHEPGAAKDRQLRTELTKLLLDKHELDGVLINVTLRDGNVRLWGRVDNAQEAALAESAAKSLPGIKSVENNLGPGPMSGVPV
jgi:CBS domain-containing protein